MRLANNALGFVKDTNISDKYILSLEISLGETVIFEGLEINVL
jgi:hypothetical protein